MSLMYLSIPRIHSCLRILSCELRIYDPEAVAKDPKAPPTKFRFDYCFDSFDPKVNSAQI